MSNIPKWAIVALVVIAIGALQVAVPVINSQPLASASLPDEYIEYTNQVVQEFADTSNGSLYLTTAESTDSQPVQHFISPLVNTKVDIKVTGMVARTRLVQTFKNAGTKWVNGLYVFPLPENAAVDHLLITIGDQKIEGQVQEKQQARKIFEQAKAAGKKASLVSQLRPNMFSNSIANIGPQESIEVTIEYQQTLSSQKQVYNLRFPMTITPRYNPESSTDSSIQVPLVENASPDNGNVELSINLKTGFEIDELTSEFHDIQTKRLSDGSHHVTLLNPIIANRDFVLNWQATLTEKPESYHFTQNVNGDSYGLIMVMPPAPNTEQLSKQKAREVIFVLDTSGSMEGQSIIQAKQALLLAIEQLAPYDSFNIIEFNSVAQNFWHKPQTANTKNKQQATEFVNNLTANGGTEMQSAFNLAFSQSKGSTLNHPNKHHVNDLAQIIFITDGSVSNEVGLMLQIKQNIGQSRLFTVGIGSAPNSFFMTEAAKTGRGTFTYIGSTAQVQEKMQQLLDKIQHPVLTDIRLALNSLNINHHSDLEFYPNVINDLYQGEPLVLSYKQANTNHNNTKSNLQSGVFNLSANLQNQTWSKDIQLHGTSYQSGLNVLWAREKIAQLTRDKRFAAIAGENSPERQQAYKTLMTQTALEHHLVSQYTSLVAVDVTPTHPSAQNSSKRKTVNQRVKGSKNSRSTNVGKLPQTATTAQLNILTGLLLMGLAICMHLLTRKV